MWFIFIDKFNGRVFFFFGVEYILYFLYFFIDVSNLGYGGVFGIKWFYGIFVEYWFDYYILVVMEMWGVILLNLFIVFYFDNSVVVYIINRNVFKDLNFMKLIRCFMVVFFLYNIYFNVEYIFGFFNIVVDFFFCL